MQTKPSTKRKPSRKPVTPPLDEELFDTIAANKPRDPDVIAFVKRLLKFAEEDRKKPKPSENYCGPLKSSRPEADLRLEIDELISTYKEAYYAREQASTKS